MNLQEWAGLLTAAGIGGVAVEAVRALLHRRNMDADAAKTVTEAAVGLVTPLRNRVTELEKDLADTERHAEDLANDLRDATNTVVRLASQVADLTTALEACHAELAEFRRMLGHPTDG